MPGDVEAVGDLATGGLLARAVEPVAGEAGKAVNGPCRNCGAMLAGPYCSACGQKAVIHRTLGEFAHDIAHGVFHFDGKIWRTLPLLAWRPGELTRRYIHGERAKFVSPFALFLFSVFLMVAVFSWAGPSGPALGKSLSSQEAASARAQELTDLKAEIARLEQLKKAGGASAAGWITKAQGRLRTHLAAVEKAPLAHSGREAAESRLAVQRLKADADLERLTADRAAALRAGKPVAALDQEIAAVKTGQRFLRGAATTLGPEGIEIDRLHIDTGIPALNTVVRHALENPQLTLYKIQSNAYKFSWALIPISVPFVWLLFFWRRDLHLFDHAVFVTYSIAFMMLLATTCVIAIQFPSLEGIGAALLLLYPIFHMYRQLRGAYQVGRAGALIRTFLLVSFSTTALLLFGALVLALGLRG
ncbi:MAG: DUF3667 domain-containing protein [Chakrabartia sp.]